MIKVIRNDKMGKSNLGWLKSIFHFSFSNYYNPDNMNFGVIRVLNDDIVESKEGFDTHPHKNMEIISYVVNGSLSHKDSLGNQGELKRGEVQYMSAGTGVFHSEYNHGNDSLRFLQIWIIPDKASYSPNYGQVLFNWEDRVNNWLHLVSSTNGNAPIKINQDANIYALYLEDKKEIEFKIGLNRQAYLIQIEGNSMINNNELFEKDALEIVEEDIVVKSITSSHILIIEMKK